MLQKIISLCSIGKHSSLKTHLLKHDLRVCWKIEKNTISIRK